MSIAHNDRKQIMHPTLINRLFATNLDFFAIFFIFMILNKITYGFGTGVIIDNFINLHGINLGNYESISAFKADYPKISEELMKMRGRQMLTFSLIQICMGVAYFYLSWSKYQKSPGKLILQQKIVDISTGEAPSKGQYIKRLVASILYPIGIFWVGFTSTGQALHDKMSGTTVIKD